MQSVSIKKLWSETPFTFIIIVINIVAYILQMLFDVIEVPNYLLTQGAINRFFVLELGEWYRILTAAFLHGGIMHVFFNVVFGLGVLTSFLERIIGTKKTALIYFISLVLSGVAVVYTSNLTTWTIGASGAIFGALGSLLYIVIFRSDLMDPRSAQSIKSILFINIIFTFLYPNISVVGHIAGLIVGFGFSFLFIDRDKSEYEIYH